MKDKIESICCIGAGYVGGPSMAVIAEKCPEIKVNVIDINEKRIESWNSNDLKELPIYEPGLSKVIEKCRNRNLFFSTSIRENIENADMIFISVNTPTKVKGLGAGKASDLKWVEACARQVAKYSKGHTIVVEKSTLPVRTAEVIKKILSAYQNDSTEMPNKPTFDVLSNPEFLAEGSAVNDLEFPDRVLIGGENKKAIMLLSQIYSKWISEDKILHTNIWSSELAKLTANAFLAQRISSINSIGAICEATGADVREVSRAIGSDQRIGSRFLDSGPGFGGSCFKKDVLNLVYLAEHFGLLEVANFWESVVHLNNWHKRRISNLVVQKLFGTVSGKNITILGFAFKANTNDTRESAAIQICSDLLEEGARLKIHDPKVKREQIEICLNAPTKELNKIDKNIHNNELMWIKEENLYEAIRNSDAVIILTEWQEYSDINWIKASKIMRKPSWVFDSRSIINPQKVNEANLNFWRIGDGS